MAEALRLKEEEEAEERRRLQADGAIRSRVSSGGGAATSNSSMDAKQWERIQSAYVELCHDNPIVSGGDGDCRYLARALIPKLESVNNTPQHSNRNSSTAKENTTQLALSSRLVDGVLQATSRVGSKMAVSTSNTNYDTLNNEPEPMFGSSSSTSQGYAELAFAIFVEGPYRCIQQSENLSVASSFLGSFQPPNVAHSTSNNQLSAEEKSRLVDEATSSIVNGLEQISMEEEKEEAKNDAKGDDVSSSSSEFFYSDKHKKVSQDKGEAVDNSMEEVFAEESDPDDFEYESSYNPPPSSDVKAIFGKQTANNSINNLDYYEDDSQEYGFSPMLLSTPNDTNQTWHGARRGIHYLLSNVSYGKMILGSLSSRSWSDYGMSDTLADLTFMLLLHHAKQDGEDSVEERESLLKLDTDGVDGEGDTLDIGTLWDRPLFLLRDRALDANNSHDALPAYLQLLQAFLSHSEEDVMSILSSASSSQCASANGPPPITAVGLSALATVCSSKEMTCEFSAKMCGPSIWSVCPRDEVKNTVLSSLDALARIVECVRPRTSLFGGKEKAAAYESEERPWIRTIVCILPMLEYLTNLRSRFDFQPVFEGGGSRNSGLTDSDAKAIQDSGLFRELLAIYTTVGKLVKGTDDHQNADSSTPTAEMVMHTQLLRTIYALSIQSTQMLGMYAVRVPDLAKHIQSSGFMEKDIVDGILWASLSSSLLESKSDAPKPRLKLRTTTKATVEMVSLAERSSMGFDTMCSAAKDALDTMKQYVTASDDQTGGVDEKKIENCKTALGDIVRFSNCLSNCPNATKTWLDSLSNKQDAPQKASSNVAELRSTIATLPSFSDDTIVARTGHKTDDDEKSNTAVEDDEGDVSKSNRKSQSLRQKKKEFGTIIASVRSSVKVIALALESQKGPGLSLKGAIPYNISSKTD